MQYFERFITIFILPFKALLKLFAMVGFVLLISIHFTVMLVSCIPIFIIQLIEYVTVWPIYYILTGKKYGEKYNTFCEMAYDILFLERPYFLKEKQKREKIFHFYTYDISDDEYIDPYIKLWRKIMKINLKLKYE